MKLFKELPLALGLIRVDGGTQSRAGLNPDTVQEYAEAMREKAEFPAIIVYCDGENYWLAEGFHRRAAAQVAGLSELTACVLDGTKRDALLHSLSANAAHGLPRTNADKRNAVRLMLEDQEWVNWADREIARHCKVSAPLVADVRRLLTVNSYSEVEPERIYTTKHGTQSVMKTAEIGKKSGVKPRNPDEYACGVCHEVFDSENWHCPTCDEHWPVAKDTCPNCYQAPVVTTLKLVSKPEAPQQVESDEAGRTSEAVGDAFDWRKISELYRLEIGTLVKENKRLQSELEQGKIEFNPSFDPDRDRDYWPEHDENTAHRNPKLADMPEWWRSQPTPRVRLCTRCLDAPIFNGHHFVPIEDVPSPPNFPPHCYVCLVRTNLVLVFMDKHLENKVEWLKKVIRRVADWIYPGAKKYDFERDRDYWPEHDQSALWGDFQGELIDCCTKELEAERDAILKNESLLYQQIADLQKTLEEVRKEREHWYGVAEEFREKVDKASKKQTTRAKELSALKSELESVKAELHEADLEIEVVKTSRDSFYEKILELKAAMTPLYDELNRLRDENTTLQAENKRMNETGRESDYQEICDLLNQVGALEDQIKKLQAQTKEPIDVTNLRSANESLCAENTSLFSQKQELERNLLQAQLQIASLEARLAFDPEKFERDLEQKLEPKKRGRKPKDSMTSEVPQ